MEKPNTHEASKFDRIDRYQDVTSSYKNYTATIYIPDAPDFNYEAQIMAVTAIGLLCRWCAELNIVFKNTQCELPAYSGDSLLDTIMKVSHGTGCRVHLNLMNYPTNASLRIGGNLIDQESFWIDCNGWLAGYGYGLSNPHTVHTEPNPLGAAFAACLGIAELFRIANGQPSIPFSKWFSLLNFEAKASINGLKNDLGFPSNFDLGRVLQIGCGAVGSNFLFFLSLTNWPTRLTLVDYDEVSIENCPNSLVFNDDDLTQKKVNICYDKFLTNNILIEPIDNDYTGYKNQSKELPHPDIILCFANERDIWRDIQYNLPPLAYHATTNKNWGINWGRHIPLKEWCLNCRFEKDIQLQPTPVFGCATGIVKDESTGKETLGMLPFLSAASALLVLVDLAKLISPQYPLNPNFLEFSFKSRQGIFVSFPQKKKPCYICSTQQRPIYSKFRQQTKFWYLSEEQVQS